MSRCVIIGGAPVKDYERMRTALREGDFCIYCDCGLRHMQPLGTPPDLIVGDFDSYTAPLPDAPVITLPREKDDTDTVYAVKEALRRGFDEFVLLGAAGGRLDHTLANVSLLVMLDRLGKKAVLMDDVSDMRIVSREEACIEAGCRFFSLLCVDGPARHVTIEGAKFPLKDAEIHCDYQYGVSNEVLPGRTARVRVGEGVLLLMRIFSET